MGSSGSSGAVRNKISTSKINKYEWQWSKIRKCRQTWQYGELFESSLSKSQKNNQHFNTTILRHRQKRKNGPRGTYSPSCRTFGVEEPRQDSNHRLQKLIHHLLHSRVSSGVFRLMQLLLDLPSKRLRMMCLIMRKARAALLLVTIVRFLCFYLRIRLRLRIDELERNLSTKWSCVTPVEGRQWQWTINWLWQRVPQWNGISKNRRRSLTGGKWKKLWVGVGA